LVKLGDLEFHVLNAGRVLLDGGAMFGVIPRPLWERKMAPDARNRVTLAMNCFLIRSGGKLILIETGAGDKMNAKLRDIYGLEDSHLAKELNRFDVKPEDIDIVVLTHLHFDHCGGGTIAERDRVVPAFPNALYITQRGEFEHAMHPTERDRASYLPENFAPLEAAGVLSLLDGDATIAPGVECIVVPGHTANMQCVKLTGGGKTAFLFADLVPTTAHLPLPWIMAFDLFPLTTLENRKRWVPEAIRQGWIALFAHDPGSPAAYLRERSGAWESEPVRVD
jgi:glyoxylase-like metal-dependent hydrolase (beta-lactamase superfamily II)